MVRAYYVPGTGEEIQTRRNQIIWQVQSATTLGSDPHGLVPELSSFHTLYYISQVDKTSQTCQFLVGEKDMEQITNMPRVYNFSAQSAMCYFRFGAIMNKTATNIHAQV